MDSSVNVKYLKQKEKAIYFDINKEIAFFSVLPKK